MTKKINLATIIMLILLLLLLVVDRVHAYLLKTNLIKDFNLN